MYFPLSISYNGGLRNTSAMGRHVIQCLTFLWYLNVSVSMFLYEPSHILIKPSGAINNDTDFGFSIAYQKVKDNLVISAPHSDMNGQIYNCPMKDILNNGTCTKLNIDVETLAPDTVRAGINPKQKFCLGASIAATSEYFLTCAPLWTTIIEKLDKHNLQGAFGTCFVYNGTDATRFQGSVELHRRSKFVNLNGMFGGIGWATLVDETNGVILVAKPSLYGDIISVRLAEPVKPIRSQVSKKNFLTPFNNIGYALAAGNFFSNFHNMTFYAFSMQDDHRVGKVAFLKYMAKTNTLTVLLMASKEVVITSHTNGSMFGAAMCACDLNADGLSDLVVGAPAHSDDQDGFDAGALYIYIGGDINNVNTERERVILASKDGSRFGTAIAANDLDGDKLPEIFVGAPYEDFGVGAIYVLSGYEVKNLLNSKQIYLSDLKLTQRIQMKVFRSFGYSLQVVPDLDENGCDELVVGAPDAASVVLYKCVPTIVREDDRNFTVNVCVHVTYHPKPVNISTKLSVSTAVLDSGATIKKPNFTVNLSERKPIYCTNIEVTFLYNESGDYQFTAQLDTPLLQKGAYIEDFNNTLVTLNQYSKLEDTLYVTRDCADEDCTTKLDMFLLWNERNDTQINYTLSSSETENVTVLVLNEGRSTKDGCVRVRMTGAQVMSIGCGRDDDVYKCFLPRPMQRHAEHRINIVLNMSKYTNMDEKLHIEANLSRSCNQEKDKTLEMNVNFLINTEHVTLNGLSHNLNVTDTEILNKDIKTINDSHEYVIYNKGSVTWKNINAIIFLEKKPFIGKYNVTTTQNNECIQQDEETSVQFHCLLDLMPHSELKIIANTEIFKEKIEYNLKRGRIEISSSFTAHLEPTDDIISKELKTVFFYQKELSFGNNKLLIICIAVILAVIILTILVFILYKTGFFKRESKQRLNLLKENIRKQSIKQSTSGDNDSNGDDDYIDEIEIEVVDDKPFQNAEPCQPTTDDNAVLIEEEKGSAHA